jgi:pantoate--beta-alanine ligase
LYHFTLGGMKTIVSTFEMQKFSEQARLRKKNIGLVPTMGYLHKGHLSLIAKAQRSCDVVITSIFVNPAQFSPNEDFARYPRNIEQDTQLCTSAGSTVLFVPPENEMYPEGYSTYVNVERLSSILEGKFRPTHFRGVTTVVAKLFSLTKPHKAFFGQKDAQQCVVIKKMVKDLNLGVEVVTAPIVREKDGLAMSSRNVYLSAEERSQALILYASLRRAHEMVDNGERNVAVVAGEVKQMIETKSSATIDYVAVVDAESLADIPSFERGIPALVALAVRFGSTRLIDNTIIKAR